MAENKRDQHGEHEIHVPDFDRPEVQHEDSDVNVWAIGKFAIALVILCGVALFGLVGLFRYFSGREAARKPERPSLTAPADAPRLPPEPRLQSTPIRDLQEMRAAEDKILNGYAWIDPDKGIVRIPIDRAMELLAQRGLPVRAQAGRQPAGGGMSLPTESGLGPKVQQPGGPLAEELGQTAAK